jgi:peptide/nickel transport system permease protein
MNRLATGASAAAPAVVEGHPARRTSLYGEAWRRLRGHRLAIVGLAFLAFFVLAAALAPWLAPYDPFEIFRTPEGRIRIWEPPSRAHPLGMDRFGRDVLSRVIYGSRVSLLVGLSVALISATIGTLLGALAGYAGGHVDNVVMRFTDAVMAFPVLFLLITVAVVAGPSVVNVIVVIGLVSWPRICRIVRAEFLRLRDAEFVVAARSLGASDARIAVLHLIPNSVASITVNITLDIARAILLEASLSFLGVGVPQPTATWGNMLHEAMSLTVVRGMPWLWLAPGICILLTVLSLNFAGDGMRDALDPRTTIGRAARAAASA